MYLNVLTKYFDKNVNNYFKKKFIVTIFYS
ncbi:hypothetical protein FLAVO9AF_720007 [Flavobacterium sp. 9AF]|nr:hypothetical protein FLAVO9AF_720007 [Flavobacterium sp. 9AF]